MSVSEAYPGVFWNVGRAKLREFNLSRPAKKIVISLEIEVSNHFELGDIIWQLEQIEAAQTAREKPAPKQPPKPKR